MLWLFGEIWLWLLIAFVLGGAIAAYILFSGLRKRETAEKGESTTASDSDVSATERTQLIRPVEPQPHFVQRPSRPSPGPRPAEDTFPDEGRKQGGLPVSASEWHARNEWPNEHDTEAAEEDRPRREG